MGKLTLQKVESSLDPVWSNQFSPFGPLSFNNLYFPRKSSVSLYSVTFSPLLWQTFTSFIL